mgnify:CR=1 FL=1
MDACYGSRWGASVLEAGFSLREIGDVSPVLQLEAGVCVVKLLQHRGGNPRPLSEVSGRIAHQLRISKRGEVEAKFRLGARQKSRIVYCEKAFDGSGGVPEGGGAFSRPPGLP